MPDSYKVKSYNRNVRDRKYFSVRGRFRFVQLLEIWMPETHKRFPLKTGFRCTKVPFKTGPS